MPIKNAFTLLLAKKLQTWVSIQNLVRPIFLVKEQPITWSGVDADEHCDALDDRAGCQEHQRDGEDVEVLG